MEKRPRTQIPARHFSLAQKLKRSAACLMTLALLCTLLPTTTGFSALADSGEEAAVLTETVDVPASAPAPTPSSAPAVGDFAKVFMGNAEDTGKSGLYWVDPAGADKLGDRVPENAAVTTTSQLALVHYFRVTEAEAYDLATGGTIRYTVECPDGLLWTKEVNEPLFTKDEDDIDSLVPFATLHIESDLVTSYVEFNPKYFESYNEKPTEPDSIVISGAYLYLGCKLAPDNIKPGGPESLDLLWSWNGRLTITLPENAKKELKLEKSNPEYDKGTGIFDWEVVYTPGVGTDKQLPKYLVDPISTEDQVLLKDSIKINGSAPDSPLLEIIEDPESQETRIQYAIPDDQSGPVTLTYQTALSDEAVMAGKDVTVENTAYAYGADLTKEPTGKSNTVSKKVSTAVGDRVTKTGSIDPSDHTVIHWRVEINTLGRNLENLVMTDTLPKGLSYITGTAQVDGQAADEVQYTDQVLTISFPNPCTQSYVVTYDTKVDQAEFDNGKEQKYTNEVELSATWYPYGNGAGDPYSEGWTGTAKKEVSPGTNAIQKTSLGYNTATHEITWKVTVNPNKVALTDATVTDALPSGEKGLTYVAGSFASEDGLTLDATSSSKNLAVKIDDATGKTLTFTFETTVDNPDYYADNTSNTTFPNTAALTGKVGSNDISTSATASQNVSSTVLEKSGGKYDYAGKTIPWTVTINKNGMPMHGVTLTDVLPEGLSYVSGSAQLGGQAVASDKLTWDEATRTLSVTLGDIDTQQTLTYTTALDVDKVSSFTSSTSLDFINSANLHRSDEGYKDVSKTATVSVTNTALAKSVAEVNVKEGYIDYRVEFNPNRITLSGSGILTDTLPDGLLFDLDMVHLFKATVDQNGKLVKGDPVALTLGEDLNYDGAKNELKITVPAGAMSYILTYRVDIIDHKASYTNHISYSEFSDEAGKTDKDVSTGGGGGGGGGVSARKGTLKLVKVDADNADAPLAGVVFALAKQAAPDLILAQCTTDAAGVASFRTFTPNTEYIVKELSVPAGYQLPENCVVWSGKMKAGETVDLGKVSNTRVFTDISFTKMNDWGRLMPGVQFELTGTDLSYSKSAVSDAAGRVTFEHVPFGRYTLTETAVPEYYAAGAVFDVEVGTDGVLRPITVKTQPTGGSVDITALEGTYTITNTVKKGGIKIIKTDSETKRPMKDVTFTIFDSLNTQRGTGVTDENGILLLPDLMLGETYTLKENTPSGYYSNDPIQVELVSGDKLVEGVMTLEVTNSPIHYYPAPKPTPTVTPTPTPSVSPSPVPTPEVPSPSPEAPSPAPSDPAPTPQPTQPLPQPTLTPERQEEVSKKVEEAAREPEIVIRDRETLEELYPELDIDDLPIPLYWGPDIAIIEGPPPEYGLIAIDPELIPLGALPQTGTAGTIQGQAPLYALLVGASGICLMLAFSQRRKRGED